MAHHLEILAPAGDVQGITAAINGGADAVYFGGKAFNARQRAKNLRDDEMIAMVKLCHSHRVKVYITLNTLVKDEEMEEAMEYIAFLSDLGPDGLIVQDPGLMDFILTHYPHLPLQTSTQASVYGLEGTLFFEELGFKRVVLPREMSLSEVKTISDGSAVELKVFCHGALCYAYSGQCLFSSLVGGRSGNRGLCAQPCRKEYTLKDARGKVLKTGYLMSMKDLNSRDYLEDILASGADSLKIEGRMKGPEYIYAVTRAYVEARDRAQGKTAAHTMDDTTLAQVFNREFTAGWLNDQRDNINQVMGKNRGVLIGKTLSWERGRVKIALNPGITLEKGDGLSFGTQGKRGVGVGEFLEKSDGLTLALPCEVAPGTPVFRSLNGRLMAELRQKALKKPEALRMPLDLHLTIRAGQPIGVEARSPVKNDAFTIDILPEQAMRKPLDEKMVVEQLEKMGDTPFVLDRCTMELEENLFLPKSRLNALRREITARLTGHDNKAESAPILLPSVVMPKNTVAPIDPILSLEITDVHGLSGYLTLDCEELVLPVEAFNNWEKLKMAVTAAVATGKTVILGLPRIMDNGWSAAFKERLPEIETYGHHGYLARNYEALHLLAHVEKPVEADMGLHYFNTLSGVALKKWGAQTGVLSPELTGKAIEAISRRSPLGCVLAVYGHQEMMVTANCPMNCTHKACDTCKDHGTLLLEDQRGAGFPVRRDALGLTHIYNGDRLFLKGEILKHRHISKWRLYALDESLPALESIIQYYKSGCPKTTERPQRDYGGRYTKGNYKRGVE